CLDPALACLVADIEADHAGEARQRVRHDGVESDRALAAPDHEESHSAFAPGKALAGRPQGADVAADRVAHRSRLDALAEAVGKCLEHLPRQVSETAVGEAGNRILLVDDQRPAGEPRSDATRARDEAAESHDDRGTAAPHDTQRLQQRDREPPGRGEQRAPPLASQSADRQPLDGDTLGGNDARLESAARAEPDDLDRLLAQPASERQRWKHVTAGAAGHDEDWPPIARRSPGAL